MQPLNRTTLNIPAENTIRCIITCMFSTLNTPSPWNSAMLHNSLTCRLFTLRRAQSRLWLSQAADTRLLRSFPVHLRNIKVGCKLYVNERPALWFPTRSPGLFFFSTIPWLISLGETNRLCQHQEFICMQVCFQPLDRPEGGRWWSCKLGTEFSFSGKKQSGSEVTRLKVNVTPSVQTSTERQRDNFTLKTCLKIEQAVCSYLLM